MQVIAAGQYSNRGVPRAMTGVLAAARVAAPAYRFQAFCWLAGV